MKARVVIFLLSFILTSMFGAYFSAEDRQKMASEDKSSEVFSCKCYIVTNVIKAKAAEDAVFFSIVKPVRILKKQLLSYFE